MSNQRIEEWLVAETKKNIYRFFLSIISKLCIVIGIVGFLGFINGFLTSVKIASWVTSSTELPWGDLSGIAVNSKGDIYLVSSFNTRIQKYSKEGKFIKGWPLKDSNIEIRINEFDQLEMADNNRTRNHDDPDTLSIYDVNDNLISTTVSDGCYEQFSNKSDLCCKDKYNNAYFICGKLIHPYIVKVSSNIKTTINMPWYLWPFLGPLPAWLFCAIGFCGGWQLYGKQPSRG